MENSGRDVRRQRASGARGRASLVLLFCLTPLHISTRSRRMSRAGASLLRMYTAPTAHSRYLHKHQTVSCQPLHE